MAFNPQQEFNNRKIIEELQTKKQLLQKGIINPSTNQNGTLTPGISMFTQSPTTESPIRANWIQASTQSFGYFIQTDSTFGNNILPVLPRYDQVTPNNTV